MARALRIPKSEQKNFIRLLTLEAGKFSSLISALKDASLTISLRDLSKEIARKVELDDEETFSLLNFSSVLYTIMDQGEFTLPDFLEQIRKAAAGIESKELAKLDWKGLDARLAELFSLRKPFGIIAKAVNVFSEHESVFCDARILTDVRPVFADEAEKQPDALLITHNLRVHYHRDGGEFKTFYIALDSEDIEELAKVLERASKKERALKETLARSGIPILIYKPSKG